MTTADLDGVSSVDLFRAAAAALDAHLGSCRVCLGGRVCARADQLAETEYRTFQAMPRAQRERMRLATWEKGKP